ncbi:MAG TPA: hypothetical protein VH763_12860 [Gemmatimonadales bacterium]|jgi:hypothetical protein
MVRDTDPLAGFQPSLQTVELLCERLGELGYPIGAQTARELLRAVFQNEAPRIDARVRDAINTSLETIRVATQSALGVLATTAPVTPAARALPPAETSPQPRAARKTPGAGMSRAGRPSGGKRKLESLEDRPPSGDGPTKRERDDLDGGERRPVFRRPRGR